MKARRIIAGVVAAAMVPGGLYAAQSKAPTKAAAQDTGAKQATKKPKTIHVAAASAVHVEATKTDDLTNAVITDVEEGTVFRADTMKVDNMASVKTADATGNLLVTDKQADVTGEKVRVYFAKSKRLAVLTGNVVIQVKPKSEQKDPTATPVSTMPIAFQNGKPTVAKPETDEEDSAESARKHPATITCDKVEYEYGKDKKHAVLTGNFKIVQKFPDHTRTVYSEHAEYFGLEDKVILHAPVRWEDTKNNQKGSTPDKVEVFTKENDERIKATNFEITQEVEDEDEKTPAGKTGQKPPATSPAAKPDEKATPPKQPVDKKAL
jgi:hypothetical protein